MSQKIYEGLPFGELLGLISLIIHWSKKMKNIINLFFFLVKEILGEGRDYSSLGPVYVIRFGEHLQ